MGNDISVEILRILSDKYKGLNPSLLFFVDNVMYITKIIDGEVVTKKAERKQDKKYDWVDAPTP